VHYPPQYYLATKTIQVIIIIINILLLL
jgi:hypothetical protein